MATDVAPRPLLTKQEVAQLLRVSTKTIDRLRERGEIHAVQLVPGGRVRYRREDVERLLAPPEELVSDATGMRVGELAGLTWGDIDEPAGRWRVSQTVAKTRKARWVPVNADVFAAVVDTVPREDRDLSAPVFAGFGIDRFRTAIS